MKFGYPARVLDEQRPQAPTAPHAGRTLALCALACAVASYWGLRFYGDTGYLFREVLDPEFPAGAITACSGGSLLWAGWNWIALGRTERDRWLVGLGACLSWLALDELLQVHEGLTHWLVAAGLPRPFGFEQDVYVFAAYALAMAPCLLAAWPRLRSHRAGLPLMTLALALAAVSQGMDMLPWELLSQGEQQWVGAVEESTKTLATFALALATARLRNGR